MAFINFMGIAGSIPEPGGVWQYFLLGLFGGIANYGLRIVVFTLALKLVLSPLDVFQRVTMRHNQKITERIKPEMDKLKAAYGNDKQLFQSKQMELNKREGYKTFAAFLPALIPIIIFLTLWPAITNISQYMTAKQYFQLYDVYTSEYNEYKLENGFEFDESGTLVLSIVFDDDEAGQIEKENFVNSIESAANEIGQDAVYKAYNEEYKVSFLWIKNVWLSDVPWSDSILGFEQFVQNIGNYASDHELSGLSSKDELETAIYRYTRVNQKLLNDEQNKTNGFLILPILAVLVSFASQFLVSRQQRKSGQVNPATSGGIFKYMMFIMPLVMGFFALSYSSIFTIYMITNSFITVVLNLLTTSTLTLIEKFSKNRTNVVKVSSGGEGVIKYGRPDPNEQKIQSKKDTKK